MRKMGDVLLDLEAILDEMVDSHDLQFGDILNLVYGHLIIHRPDAREEYIAGGNPIFKYGPAPDRKKAKKELLKLFEVLEGCKLRPKEADEVLDLIEKEYK